MTDKIVVLSTCDSEETARKVARLLVESRLAACVNVLPGLTSFYWWQGKIDESAEWLLVIKSSRALFPKLRDQIAKAHPYEIPEILALAVVDGADSYLQWLDRELQTSSSP